MENNQGTNVDERLITFAEKRNMKIHIAGELIFITTPFGKWYMDKTEFPIRLYHFSSWMRSRKPKQTNFKAEYHKQEITFDSYFKALTYIYKHDFNKIRRDIARENHFVNNAKKEKEKQHVS